MKKSFKILSAAILTATMAFGLGATILASNNSISKTEAYYTPGTHYSVSDTASELASYYSTISSSATGSDLLSALRTLNSNKRQKTVGYSTMGTGTDGAFIYTDYDLNNTATDNNGQKYGTKVASFYTKTSATSWNREHTWPKSHGGNLIEGDILMTRPTITQENSDRGNSFYVEGKNSTSAGWDPYTAGYAEWCRGECARIILYGCVANSNLSLSDADSHSTSNNNPDNLMGNINTLIKWHFAYTPNEYEMNRNNGAEYLQGNRNPFVDHPEYVAKIWSSYNTTVSNLCSNNSSVYSNWTVGSCSTYGTNNASGGTSTNPSVSITASSTSIKVGGTSTLTANKNNVTGTVSWSVTDGTNNVVSLSATTGNSITVTGVAAGTKTIKATVGSVSATTTITVSEVSAAGEKVTSVSDVANNDEVYIRTEQDTPNGVSGYNGSKDANISTTESSWVKYVVKDKSSSGFKLYDSSASQYIASPGGNEFKYSTTGGTCSPDSEGHLVCNSRYLCINGSNNRFYTGIGSYTPFFIYKVGSTSTKTLSSIAVKTAPTKTTYTAGEYFAPAGLVITATYSDNSHEDISYASNTSAFTFAPSTSTALTTSNTSVTITYGGKSCSQAITVNAAATPTVNSVTVSPSTLSLAVNGTSTLTATVSVSNGAAQTVTWTSNNTSVATVNSSGKVTAVAAGTATITATSTVDSNKKGTCTVTVTSGSTTTTTYNKVSSSSDLTSGQYLIVYETGSLAFNGALTSLDATSNTISVTISNNQITKTSATEASEFTIDTSAGTILSASGKYIGNESNSNSLTSSSTELTNTITYNNGDIDVVSSGGAYLRYNTTDGQARFRYYKSSSYTNQEAIQFYKLSGSSTAKTLSSIAVSDAQTSYTTGDTFVKPTVTATFSDNSQVDVTNSATFSGYDMSVAGAQTVTVSYTYGSVTKEATYTITVTQGSTPVTTYEQVTGSLSAGDKVVIVAQANRSSNSGYAMKSEVINSYYFDKVDASISNQKLNYTSDMAVWTVGGNSTSGFTFYNETEAKYFYGYTTTSGTKTYRDLGLTTDTTQTGINWTVSANAAGTGYDVTTTHNSNTIYLEYYTDKSNFSAYTASATDVVINFYKETTASTSGAATYAATFLSAFTCNAQGTSAPTFTTSWAQLKTAFNALELADRNTLKNATANESGTDIEKAMARYDYVVAKYGYENFINRTSGNSANRMNNFNSDSANNLLLVLGSMSLLGGLTYLAYFLKKRKED